MTRLKCRAAVMFGLVLSAATAAAQPAGVDRYDGPQWPNIVGSNLNCSSTPMGEPRWPNIRLDDVESKGCESEPGFRRSGTRSRPASWAAQPRVPARSIGADKPLATPAPSGEGLRCQRQRRPRAGPSLHARQAVIAVRFRSRHALLVLQRPDEFGFANGSPFFGVPTSTLDWHGLDAHSGELFARIDHKPTGFFVKGVVGLGTVVDGEIIDRDFLFGQFKFSDTTSNVKDGNLRFAMFDVGWSYSPVGGVKLGFFAGYHYWYEKVTAYGLICNQPSFLGCTSTGEF